MAKRMRVWGWLAGWAMMLAADMAWACPVCGEAKETQRTAYAVMSLIMTALPLVVIVSIAVWVVRRLRAFDRLNTPEVAAPEELSTEQQGSSTAGHGPAESPVS